LETALRAVGTLSDAVHTPIRERESKILARLAANNNATPQQVAELRELVGIVVATWRAD